MIKERLRILHLEDSPLDAELVGATLKAQGVQCDITLASSRAQFLNALGSAKFDIILADHSLPGFDGLTALGFASERCPETPFIFVTGSMGEERAVEILKRGATDYVLKERLFRLSTVLTRAVQEANERSRRQDAEQQILEQAALLDKAREAIFVQDLNFRFLYWNKGAERLYGWPAAEARGRHVDELLLASNRDKVIDRAQEVLLKTGEWTGELQHRTRAGNELTVESSWTLMRDASGKPKSILVINNDITERKRFEAQLLRTQRLESLGALAGGIAHDLNNVLAPILMAMQLLRLKIESPEDFRILDTVESSAQRGADMVKQILSFARGHKTERTVLQLKILVTEMVKVAHDTFPSSIEIQLRTAPDLWNVSGDHTQLYQVLMNLCVNARDAMPNGGRLQVSLDNVLIDENEAAMYKGAEPGAYVAIRVSDTGAGIPPDILGQIFEPFFTTKDIGKGSGLGLSTVRSIVESHGGFINVYSELHRGTEFKIYLPAVRSAETRDLLEQRPEHLTGNGEMILAVDDEVTIREITKGTLENYGYRVLTASDGTEALAAYAQRNTEIDAVIMDLAMPFLDGRAAIRALRRINPELKVIAVSGLADNYQNWDAQNFGEVVFLLKPYTSRQLLEALHQLLRS